MVYNRAPHQFKLRDALRILRRCPIEYDKRTLMEFLETSKSISLRALQMLLDFAMEGELWGFVWSFAWNFIEALWGNIVRSKPSGQKIGDLIIRPPR